MDSNMDKSALTVDGFQFYTEKDAKLARAEKQKIEYLEERVDYSSPESIRYVYGQIIRERLFRTPVGLWYLKTLREFLLKQPGMEPEGVAPIPLYMTFDGELRDQTNPARARVAPSKKGDRDKEKRRYTISVLLNVLLVLAIVAMFGIAFASDQPNIINYERVIVSEYASWEQELTDREQIVRQKELELKLKGE